MGIDAPAYRCEVFSHIMTLTACDTGCEVFCFVGLSCS